ncbi:MAG: SDR family NAD(P)-dependent oxidoreductase, partial [Gammaproteobacteria bacterium]|nr:SDR family NAD(P)-dependent oxidoreductase [Gammaproteobacteria bacterium]
MDIKDKVAIVTGAAAGIGQAYAYAVAENGAAAVVLADLDEAGLAQTAAGVEQRGARAQASRVDVTDTEQLESLFANTQQQFGSVDIVF